MMLAWRDCSLGAVGFKKNELTWAQTLTFYSINPTYMEEEIMSNSDKIAQKRSISVLWQARQNIYTNFWIDYENLNITTLRSVPYKTNTVNK